MDKIRIYNNVNMGCDPEFFFKKGNKTIESEDILPEKGLDVGDGSKFIIDGLQAELNPIPDPCRANLANEIHRCFLNLYENLQDSGIKVDFSQTKKLSKNRMATLKERSKEFGCAPSRNHNGKSKITVDPKKYQYRSAGGHIHLSASINNEKTVIDAVKDHKKLVKLLDVLLGNTCVLLDRDRGNIERRKVYGRAGEYRTPRHKNTEASVEYRTLSNFWLRSYPLMSFVFSMARFAVHVIAQSTPSCDYYNMIMKNVNMKDIEKAINRNDLNLALKNFNKIKSTLLEISNLEAPINDQNIRSFEKLVSNGIDVYFDSDPFMHWVHLPEAHDGGWETFMSKMEYGDI